jgi:hypothetical protein
MRNQERPPASRRPVKVEVEVEVEVEVADAAELD